MHIWSFATETRFLKNKIICTPNNQRNTIIRPKYIIFKTRILSIKNRYVSHDFLMKDISFHAFQTSKSNMSTDVNEYVNEYNGNEPC